MASYVPHYAKKRERLQYREEKLLRSIRRGDARDSQLRLAEEVRLAMIRAIRAERATFVPRSGGHTDRVAVLDARITSLDAMTPEEILAGFTTRNTKLGGISDS